MQEVVYVTEGVKSVSKVSERQNRRATELIEGGVK